jgi:hypothetical protein
VEQYPGIWCLTSFGIEMYAFLIDLGLVNIDVAQPSFSNGKQNAFCSSILHPNACGIQCVAGWRECVSFSPSESLRMASSWMSQIVSESSNKRGSLPDKGMHVSWFNWSHGYSISTWARVYVNMTAWLALSSMDAIPSSNANYPVMSRTPRRPPADSIVWSISTCPSLTCWDLELAFHRSLFPECGPFGKFNRSNRFLVCDWRHNYVLILYLKIR